MAKPKTAEATEAIATTGTTAMVEYDYGDDEGKGFEHQTKADTSIPFIVLFQALSPQVVEGTEKPGSFFNTVTEQIWTKDQGLLFVPATTRHYFAEWTPRDQGGGFHGHHEIDEPMVLDSIKRSKKFGKYSTPDGNVLTETFYVYGIICSENGEPESMGVIAFWSTKIRSYKSWMSRLHQVRVNTASGKRRPPLYAHLTRITSVLKKNTDGNQFYVPVISTGDQRGIYESLIPPSDERFQMAKACAELVDSGDAKVDFSKQADAGDKASGEEVPF